ncbi:tissue factor pathway inhibitor 2 [Stegostoma tigrinum]|uniref:tissue factor pathway inhibitor 2 n=1 Tax=Stegostoma tigrinum TaxID=3053191 RepID=UPI00202B3C7E|nr:tissue factor pathway inhibitor 2 [Stegostoma tigrinum]XP_059511164.1 tissue factor pathway inhibitor 2 [Stegostoma tigrinum]XP_059511167.1 tissue factor pathway inhibitor 2 [Stegostoma tigrinum]XP_059511174.1 tissue factor pathway inhibitor 2 [Stegostoma tigrinum]
MDVQFFAMTCSILLLLLASQVNMAKQDNRGVCSLLPDPGPCKALIQRFYYNRYTQNCEEFEYGGCSGNANNFKTLKECTRHCRRIKKVPKACRLEADSGPCRAYLERYFYNFTTGQCEEFVFGGCRGNENNFKDVSSCQNECKPISALPSFCTKPKDKGTCAADILRFYFNDEKGICETFDYSGCGGNNNNFISLNECQKICQPRDQKPVKSKDPVKPSYKIIQLKRRTKFLRNQKRET